MSGSHGQDILSESHHRKPSSSQKVEHKRKISVKMSSLPLLGRYGIFIAIVGFGMGPISALAASVEQRSPDVTAQNSSVLRIASSSNFEVECKPATYGLDLNVPSCMEALGLIPRSETVRTFGLRGRLGVDQVTPWRWISCELSSVTWILENMTTVVWDCK